MVRSTLVSEERANSGVDLHLELVGPRLRSGLEKALRESVRTGRLPAGVRLPSSRTLAHDLGISRNTVTEAYGQLVAEGWLMAQQGSGTRVARPSVRVELGSAPATSKGSKLRFDLRAGSPDLSSFPRSGWLAAARRALNTAPNSALGYGDPKGLWELRVALADYLSRTRGVRAEPDRILICAGFAQGLALLCQVLRGRGAQTLATEAYGQRAHLSIAAAAGLHLRTILVDGQGARTAELGDADAALLTPAHQFPLGMALAPQRRTLAVEWAAQSGRLVIEDDYDGEFRFDRPAVGALQALAPEQVVYAGTASKTLAPGLRLGWLVLPAHLVTAAIATSTLANRQSSALEQLTLAEFIASGAYDRHVRRARFSYRRRRDRLVTALRREVPGVHISGIAAGLHALVSLPEGSSETEVIARAARGGLAVEGLRGYSQMDHQHSPALVIGYGTPAEHAFTGAVARLCAALGDSR